MGTVVTKPRGDSAQALIGHGAVERAVEIWPKRDSNLSQDLVADETAVALVYNGVSHAVMMASPVQLEAFARGFSLSEGIVSSIQDIYEIQVAHLDEGIEVALTISSECFAKLKTRRRNLTGRTGCGLCGVESLQQVRLPLSKVQVEYSLSHTAIDHATRSLSDHQPLQSLTGAIHGAAWCDLDGNILQVCEDVGRHNALDKLIGLRWQQGQLGQEGFLLISSRASHEILQKSAIAGIGFVVALSAPTSLAIELANQASITLVGFSRENRHIGYANTQRLLP